MGIGMITSVGKQKENESSGSLFRVSLSGTGMIGGKACDITCYTLVSRMIVSIDDMVDYILGKPTGTKYYPCNGINTSPSNALAIFTRVTGFRSTSSSPGGLSLSGVNVYGSNNQVVLSVNVSSISCERM